MQNGNKSGPRVASRQEALAAIFEVQQEEAARRRAETTSWDIVQRPTSWEAEHGSPLTAGLDVKFDK